MKKVIFQRWPEFLILIYVLEEKSERYAVTNVTAVKP